MRPPGTRDAVARHTFPLSGWAAQGVGTGEGRSRRDGRPSFPGTRLRSSASSDHRHGPVGLGGVSGLGWEDEYSRLSGKVPVSGRRGVLGSRLRGTAGRR